MYRPPETEHTVGKFWCDQLPSVSDIWRHRHPTGRMMTHFGGRSAARLDRFYIGDDGTAYAGVNSRIQRPRRENGSFLSDHCPVVMELAQKIIEGDRGASFAPRLRMYFASENDLVTEFITWLASKKAHMPINYKARLKWWRRLKRDISRKVFRLNGIQRARQRAPVAVLREELEELYTFIEGSDPLAAATSLAALPEARQAVAAAEEALEDVFQLKQKRDWIHNHERPTRALTGQLNPKKHQGVSALRAANGEIVGTSIGCARVVTTHCAAVSAKPTTTNAAQNLVLDAMERQGSPVLDSGRAEVLGSVVVTEQEVLVALRRSKPGKAPGRDGIPVELYKKFKTQFVPILAGVFTAIGVLKNLPCGFLDGVITVLYKKGDRVDAGNYRPISLTNTDYRVLARVLAGRLGEVLPDLVDPAQTAFIKGRCIGDNAMLLQFVAALLKEEGRSAVLALCDFRKAYDTVDRYFLLAVATKMGLGHGFVQWVRLLLEGTRSAAIINGYLAEPKLLLAGVRQGCPLAPLLYLLIGQALLCWIKDQGIGIQIAGSLLSGSQFADDLKALLDGPQQIPAFKAAMATFATASGQHLLPAKTQLLFIGVPPTQPLPAEIEGMPVVHRAKALGLWFEEFTGEVSVDWQEMKNRVAGKLAKISRLNLSCFGRAFSVNSYALGTFLYHAEFAGLQQDNELEKWIAAVVDRSQGPPPGRGFAGVAAVNLVGHPKEGAFGLMPLAEHVKARAARWPLRLVTEDLACPTPWVRVARALVQRALAGTQTKYDKRLFMLSPPRGEAAGYPHNYPKLVRKILQAVATLPVATVLDESEWQPGPWCHVMPLWGNPMLQSDTGKGGYEFSEAGCYFRECPWQTLGELLKARTQIQQWSQQEWQQHGSTFATYIGYYGLGTQRGDALEKIEEFLNYLNKPAWILAAEAAESALVLAGQPLPDQAAVVDKLCKSIGWKVGNRSYTPENLTVKIATTLVTQPPYPKAPLHPNWLHPRSRKFRDFALQIGGGLSKDKVVATLGRLWILPIDNSHKEIVWRLALDGLPTIQRLHRPTQVCGCGGAVGDAAGRQHVYFNCAAIRPIIDSIEQQLQDEWALPPQAPSLQCHHLWMAVRPTEAIHQGIWDVVCISALKAMDSTRAGLFKRQFAGAQPRTALAASVGVRACAQFWANIASFCGHNLAPRAWRGQVSPTHPFISFNTDSEKWNLNRSSGSG